jgi:hypothetical protein
MIFWNILKRSFILSLINISNKNEKESTHIKLINMEKKNSKIYKIVIFLADKSIKAVFLIITLN